MTTHRYHAFGLEIDSEVALHAFAPGHGGSVQVDVTVGKIADPSADGSSDELAMANRNWVARQGRLDLVIPGVARLRIEGGRSIRVEPALGKVAEDALAHIQGSALGAVLQQRGIVSMHAGAFESDQGAVLIIGTSGGGKSTLLNAVLARGFRMISDDMTPITLDGGKPMATPGFPASRLWRDSAEYRGHDVSLLTRVHHKLDKFYIDVPRFRNTRQAVAAVVVVAVSAAGEATLANLSLGERVEALVRYTFRKQYLCGQRLHGLQFATVNAIAAHARVIQLVRPAAGTSPDALAGMVIEALGCSPAVADCARTIA